MARFVIHNLDNGMIEFSIHDVTDDCLIVRMELTSSQTRALGQKLMMVAESVVEDLFKDLLRRDPAP